MNKKMEGFKRKIIKKSNIMKNSKICPKMNKNNTALLVIDIVNGCAHKEAEIPEWDITFSKLKLEK